MKIVAEAVDMMTRISCLEDRLNELSVQVKRDPELRSLPEWQGIQERVKGCERQLERLTVSEFEELERWARRVRVWRTMQDLD